MSVWFICLLALFSKKLTFELCLLSGMAHGRQTTVELLYTHTDTCMVNVWKIDNSVREETHYE